MQTSNQAGRGGIEQFVADTEYASTQYGWNLAPVALFDDLLQRNAVAGAAPRGDQHVGLGRAVLPGSPMQLPPAAAINSATQGCDAMIGLPHSSQNTRGFSPSLVD